MFTEHNECNRHSFMESAGNEMTKKNGYRRDDLTEIAEATTTTTTENATLISTFLKSGIFPHR